MKRRVPTRPRLRDPLRFPVADHELSEAEIAAQYGDLIATAARAFAVDHHYLLAMSRSAKNLIERRKQWAAIAEARRAAEGSALPMTQA